MSGHSKSILDAALLLPADDRAEIAERLILSLDEEYQREVKEAWNSELRRRLDDVDRGSVELIPADEVMRRIRERRNV